MIYKLQINDIGQSYVHIHGITKIENKVVPDIKIWPAMSI